MRNPRNVSVRQEASTLSRALREEVTACVFQNENAQETVTNSNQLFKNIVSAFGDKFDGPITNVKKSTI